MKRFLLGAIIVLLAAHPAFSQTKNPSAVPESASEAFTEAKRGIDKGNAEWIEAWEKGNPERIAAIFTDDGIMLSQAGKVFKGRQQILERQKAAMQSVTPPVKVSVITVKIWLDGDTAYETGKYKYEYTEKGKPDDGGRSLCHDVETPRRRLMETNHGHGRPGELISIAQAKRRGSNRPRGAISSKRWHPLRSANRRCLSPSRQPRRR